jgi:hypothetical protein
MFLLHAHGGEESWFSEIFLHGFLETLKLIPFLFLTYLLMEFIEHRASDGANRFMNKAGAFGPAIGGALGAVPQCGFCAAASNLYAGRVITLGTLVAVFLSASDEMLPIMISGEVPLVNLLLLLLYKAGVAIAVGFGVDLAMRLLHIGREEINIDEICDNDNCHCERGIWYSALHHTVTISIFVLIMSISINALIFFIGEENLGAVMYDKPFISHLIAAVFGLIPNCAASVALATLCKEGLITVGTMLSGLFSGAGVGLLVLFRVNKRVKENLIIVSILVLSGFAFGLIGDLIFPAGIFG